MKDEIIRVTWASKRRVRSGDDLYALVSYEQVLADVWRVPQEELDFSAKEAAEQTVGLCDCLTGRHREIVERYLLNGEMQQDIAREWGVTYSRVSQVYRQALDILREQFADRQVV